MRVRWTPAALADRDEAFDYLIERSLQAAVALVEAFDAASDRLAEHPLSGRIGRVAGTREFLVSGMQYLLVYRVTPDCVRVLRALHTARQWPPADK